MIIQMYEVCIHCGPVYKEIKRMQNTFMYKTLGLYGQKNRSRDDTFTSLLVEKQQSNHHQKTYILHMGMHLAPCSSRTVNSPSAVTAPTTPLEVHSLGRPLAWE